MCTNNTAHTTNMAGSIQGAKLSAKSSTRTAPRARVPPRTARSNQPSTTSNQRRREREANWEPTRALRCVCCVRGLHSTRRTLVHASCSPVKHRREPRARTRNGPSNALMRSSPSLCNKPSCSCKTSKAKLRGSRASKSTSAAWS